MNGSKTTEGTTPAERWFLHAERLCREARFREALEPLEQALAYSVGEPRAKYQLALRSWYGLVLATVRGDVVRGRRLCEESIGNKPLDPQLYVNLARVYVASERKDLAMEALQTAFSIDPRNRDARDLAQQLGQRRPPVFPFLTRANPLNRLAGRIRHKLQS